MSLNSITLLSLSAVLLMGCARNVNTVQSYGGDKQARFDLIGKVNMDRTLKGKANVIDTKQAIVGSNILKVQANIQNSTSRRQRVRYRFEWIDDNGMRIKTDHSMWHPLDLNGKETVWVTQVAPTPMAVDFRISLIESDR